jgi:tetratricopeptide (TPR) repeat protein
LDRSIGASDEKLPGYLMEITKKRIILLFIYIFTKQFSFSQDTSKSTFSMDSTFTLLPFSTTSYRDYSISHDPSKADKATCKKHARLITAEPTQQNHKFYFGLACALWELNRLSEAEHLFLKIINSQKPYYTRTFYYASDISGDHKMNTYGYGSYTTNYKNYACRYLAKIYIEEKKFDPALKYIELADKIYTAEQNCGTGYAIYRSEIDGLYGLCYEGLESNKRIIERFLPTCFNWGFSSSNGVLVRALKKIYPSAEIDEQLKIAESSIVCVADTFQSSSFTYEHYGEKNEIKVEKRFTSGSASMNLFGVTIQAPTPQLEDGEIITKERFVKEFKGSAFYKSLTSDQ